VATFRIREASSLPGVSVGTLRRWADDGRIDTITDASGRLAAEAVDKLGLEPEMLAVVAVKSTNVCVEMPTSRPARPSAPTRKSRRAG
jgi:hypothetical protein